MILFQPKNCFFYIESYSFYSKSILKSSKIEFIYYFISKFLKKTFFFVPSMIFIFFKNLNSINPLFFKSLFIVNKQIFNSILNNLYLVINYVYKFKSIFKKKFDLTFFKNYILYFYKSTTKGFKKILKVFGIDIDFHYI